MSHFTVLVIGENVDEELAPFQENNMGDCPPEYMKFMCWVEGEKHIFDSEEEAKEALGEKFNEEEAYWENPNAKWDWYSVGGRWSGFLKLKEGGKGETGRPGVFGYDEETKGKLDSGLWVDQARKRDIDLEGMREEAAEEAKKAHREVIEAVEDKLEGFKTWEELLNWWTKDKVDEARDEYHAQPAVKAFKETKQFHYMNSVEEFITRTEIEYVDRAIKKAICPFAVLKDGIWYEKGEMLMFAAVKDEKEVDEWYDTVHRLIDEAGEDEIFTVVDCHI